MWVGSMAVRYAHFMEPERIAQLLHPYLEGELLTPDQLDSISSYIDLLLTWNRRVNLTAVRDPEEMVRRHFGESIFAARKLVEAGSALSAADVGSGAGFPGIPLKIYAPQLQLTLIESHGKKATFLREVIRHLRLTNVNVFQDRADRWTKTADLITLRAVEKFETVLPSAAALVSPGGRLALLIGEDQVEAAQKLVPGTWLESRRIPESNKRVLKWWIRT